MTPRPLHVAHPTSESDHRVHMHGTKPAAASIAIQQHMLDRLLHTRLIGSPNSQGIEAQTEGKLEAALPSQSESPTCPIADRALLPWLRIFLQQTWQIQHAKHFSAQGDT